jgi:hypothetical protein
MASNTSRRNHDPWTDLDEVARAKYFALRYGLPADQLTFRSKLEAAARRVVD